MPYPKLEEVGVSGFGGAIVIHIYECFEYINQDGVALDEFWNEYRDDEGNIVIVPVEDRHLFKVVERC